MQIYNCKAWEKTLEKISVNCFHYKTALETRMQIPFTSSMGWMECNHNVPKGMQSFGTHVVCSVAVRSLCCKWWSGA